MSKFWNRLLDITKLVIEGGARGGGIKPGVRLENFKKLIIGMGDDYSALESKFTAASHIVSNLSPRSTICPLSSVISFLLDITLLVSLNNDKWSKWIWRDSFIEVCMCSIVLEKNAGSRTQKTKLRQENSEKKTNSNSLSMLPRQKKRTKW